MNGFLAVVLICANTVPVQACEEATATDVLKTKVASEIGCATGWQEIIARSEVREGIGRSAYLKTQCRRIRAGG
ncbi:hypothetical protein [Methylobacterium isbiliense]|jgi:hypothetical protein|uniref:Uncharacterized protein n=1 Tax=Methylobacterium isbiliense TaxID=315478 RepID=A0ABQ4S949_9HYPH|nr:hypothetical protein [Methylobacterium isbiliense]MDN3622866.1 hypothetical protein [Methylobacterium isbiliense]GJD98328.1 hypothetical protein GMJLKIPL_0235 [Methylobacterium isbiliense]